MTFYEKLCELAESHGKTITQSMTDCGLSTGTLSDMRNGGGVKLETAQKLARYFNEPLTVFEDCEVKRNA